MKVATLVGTFVLGPVAASQMSRALSPDGVLIQTIAPFAFASIFAIGMFLWIYLGFFTLVVKWLGLKARRLGPGGRGVAPDEEIAPPGYGSFVVVGTLVGTVLGVAAGATSGASFGVSMVAWTVLGSGYGMLLSAAAHHGYMPFPQDD